MFFSLPGFKNLRKRDVTSSSIEDSSSANDSPNDEDEYQVLVSPEDDEFKNCTTTKIEYTPQGRVRSPDESFCIQGGIAQSRREQSQRELVSSIVIAIIFLLEAIHVYFANSYNAS